MSDLDFERKSEYTGVIYVGNGRWKSQLCRAGKTMHVGVFDSEEKARDRRQEFLEQQIERGLCRK